MYLKFKFLINFRWYNSNHYVLQKTFISFVNFYLDKYMYNDFKVIYNYVIHAKILFWDFTALYNSN